MKLLKQNYHGLPGLGINGQIGETGDRGNSIYFGFINDFFDGETIGIDTYIYVAKRLIDDTGDASALVEQTLQDAWKVTQAELYQYKDASLFELVKNSSNDLSSPYINYKTFYYTGNRLTSHEMINSSMYESYNKQHLDPEMFTDVSTKGIELDINGDYISMSFMLSSLKPNNKLKDISQYSYENDLTVVNNLIDSEKSLTALYQNVTSKVSHYEFDNNAAIIIDNKNLNNNKSHIPFDIDDAIYYNSSIVGDLYELGDFLDNQDCSKYYVNYPSGTSTTYISENIKYPGNSALLAGMDSNIYEGIIMPGTTKRKTKYVCQLTNTEFISSEFASQHWETIFKTSSKINKYDLDQSKQKLIKAGDILDDYDNAYYGMPTKILFSRDNNNSTTINKSEIIPQFRKDYYAEDLNYYTSHVMTVINTSDGTKLYYSLDEDNTKVFIPFTLSDRYKVGDILYFYTDSTAFYTYYNIEYMVVITEDLLNCTPTQLINAALLQNPLNTKVFSDIIDNRLNSFHNVAILYDKQDISNNKSKQLTNKSYISILNGYTKSPLVLCSSSLFNTLNTSINGTNKQSSIKVKDNKFVFDINNPLIQLKMNNLNVNTNNITSITNVELQKLVYNPNIILYDNDFIKPLVDIDLFYEKNIALQSVFIQNINAEDYFYDVDKLDNYFYGCDIYNKDMEKIKTISSTSKNLVVEIVPTIDNTIYYIQMFASCGSSLKYYSKITKLTITYSKIKLDEIKPMKLPNGYASPIGKYSTETKKTYVKTIGKYSYRQQITSFKLDIIGENQQILKEKISGNIIFSISNITSEQIDNASLKIYADNDNVEIESILFNHIEQNASSFTVNDWSSIIKNDISTYTINMSTNLPIFDTSISTKYSEYVLTGASIDVEQTQESPLFSNLKDNIKVQPTKQRSILVTAKYKLIDSSEYYYENFNIIQPGFEDTRDLPNVKLDIHSNIIDLQTFNSIENNVLSNQFITYLDVDITDFKKQWGKFANDASISMDLTITNLAYDLDWQHKYIVRNLKGRRTFRGIYNKNDIENIQVINNYVKFNVDLIDTTLDSSNVNLLLSSKLYKNDNDFIQPTTINDINSYENISEDNNGNGKYIIFDSSFNNILNDSKCINAGLQNDIQINLNNITLDNDYDKIKIKLSMEFGNPIISNMYYRFYVKNMTIKVNDKIFYTLVPDSESLSENANTTYLCAIDKLSYTSDKIVDLKYKYISDVLDVTFNPLSYTITPNDIESSYTNVYGDIYKYGISEQIIKELKFFNSSVYTSNEYVFKAADIRENYFYDFSNLMIKKSYIQDNIKNINVKPISLYSLINKINTDIYKSLKIDECLKTHNVLDFIEGNKYLGIVYHSTIMQPKIRNDKYTFYYNDKEYVRTKYDQKINNLPVFAYDEQSIELRDDLLINSMDKWNDWYSENYKGNNNTYTGVLSLYGNGYTQILDSDSNNVTMKTVSGKDNVLDIDEVKSLNDVYINEYSQSNEVNINPMKQIYPNNGDYFRGFLYDINWEFPYYDKSGIIPYRIVSPFDNLLNNCVSDRPSIYNTYYRALTNTRNAPYGTHMIPYTLLYNIEPRIAYNYETKGINVFMLRRPSIGVDTDIIGNLNDFKEKYEFNRRLFNLSSSAEKLTSPYTIK